MFVSDTVADESVEAVRVVVALDKFKGTVTSRDAGNALERGIRSVAPTTAVRVMCIADGGNGSIDALLAHGFSSHPVEVGDLHGDVTSCMFAGRDSSAFIETAMMCGSAAGSRSRRQPMTSTTAGAGETVIRALDLGFTRIVLGLGGSGTTDGGAGLLLALGAELLDHHGRSLLPGGAALGDLVRIDWSNLDPRLVDVDLVVAGDVDSPLLGPAGAASMFGPQKGASLSEITILEHGLANLVDVARRSPPPPALTRETPEALAAAAGAGAAGGLGFGAMLVGARSVSGGDLLMDLVGLASAIDDADLVITGEGCLDEQTLRGKAAHAVARLATANGVRTIAVVGQNQLGPELSSKAGFSEVYALSAMDPNCANDADLSISLLTRVGHDIGAALRCRQR